MKRIRALGAVVLVALCSGLVPGASEALPFTARAIPINASGVSDVVYESGVVFGSQAQSGKVYAVDPTAGTIIAVLTVDVSRTHAMAADRVAHRVYVTNYDAGTLSVIDSAANPPVVLTTTSVGARPVAVDVDPTSQRVFIGLCCEESRTIVAVDVAVSPPVVLATVLVGQGPDHLAVDESNGMVYVANYDSSSVSMVTGRTDPPVQIGFVPLPKDPKDERPLRPNALAVDPTTHFLVVSCGDATAQQHQVEVIDVAAGKSVASVNTGMFIAYDVDVDASKGLAWFTLPTNRNGNLYSLTIDPSFVGKVGPRASLITPNFANFTVDEATARVFGAGQDSIVVLEDDAVLPVPTFVTETGMGSVQSNIPPAVTRITGAATDDNSGIAAVLLTFTLIPTKELHDLRPELTQIGSTIFATITCADNPRHDCSWSRVPGVNAGLYSVHATAIDFAGNRGESASDIIVLVI